MGMDETNRKIFSGFAVLGIVVAVMYLVYYCVRYLITGDLFRLSGLPHSFFTNLFVCCAIIFFGISYLWRSGQKKVQLPQETNAENCRQQVATYCIELITRSLLLAGCTGMAYFCYFRFLPSVSNPTLGTIVLFLSLAFIIIGALIFLSLYRLLEYQINPLTETEQTDRLTREIVLDLPYDPVFNLCVQSLHHVWRWSLKAPSRKDNSIYAWAITNVFSGNDEKIKMVLTNTDEGKTRIEITGFYNKNCWRWGKYFFISFPLQRRRWCIRRLDRIRAYLLAHNS